MTIFNLPDLGEGLPDAEISQWYVKEGDLIKVDEPMVAMETAKAVVDVPSPIEGKILKLHGNPGDVIKTGHPLVEYEVLGKATEKDEAATVAGKIEVGNQILKEAAIQISTQSGHVKVTPAVRAIAKSLSVDLSLVTPTGINSTITAEDVKSFAKSSTKMKSNQSIQTANSLAPGYEALKGVRRAMHQAMSHSHEEVVPVTIFDDADVTNWIQKDDITTRLIQAVVKGCEQEPALNAWFDGQKSARFIHKEVNLGLAIDTEDGLFVAIIPSVQKQTSSEIRQNVDKLKEGVKNRTLSPEQLKGQTITLSNFGKFAGRYASPIIVPPTTAIIAIGSLREEAIVIQGEIKIRKVLPISLSFDHRCITGGEATRFLGAMLAALT